MSQSPSKLSEELARRQGKTSFQETSPSQAVSWFSSLAILTKNFNKRPIISREVWSDWAVTSVWRSNEWDRVLAQDKNIVFHVHFLTLCFPGFMMRALWIWGITPPPAMVALIRVSSSSSPRRASCKWRGVMRLTFRSLLALPANSSTSAVRYSRIAAE